MVNFIPDVAIDHCASWTSCTHLVFCCISSNICSHVVSFVVFLCGV